MIISICTMWEDGCFIQLLPCALCKKCNWWPYGTLLREGKNDVILELIIVKVKIIKYTWWPYGTRLCEGRNGIILEPITMKVLYGTLLCKDRNYIILEFIMMKVKISYNPQFTLITIYTFLFS